MASHMFERGKQAEGRAQGGRTGHGVLVEAAAQGAPRGGNAGRGPVERLAKVRFSNLPSWRKDSRSRMAGGETSEI